MSDSMKKNIFHKDHFNLFNGPYAAVWIRKMVGAFPVEFLEDQEIDEGMVEMATAISAEMGGGLAAVFGVAIELDEVDEDEANVPVAVYYYIMQDCGRTHHDATFIEPTRLDEEIVALPEWFPAHTSRVLPNPVDEDDEADGMDMCGGSVVYLLGPEGLSEDV
jgi:hypothetical protein